MNGFLGLAYQKCAPAVNPRTGKPLRRNQRKRAVFIYGLFDLSGSCRYVGQTTNPAARLYCHHFKARKRQTELLQMKVFRACVPEQSSQLEKQIFQAYRKRGQCDLNLKQHFTVTRGWTAVLWVEKNRWFESICHAAEYFRCSTTTITNWSNGKNPPDNVTLQILP